MASIDPRLIGERRKGADRKLTPEREMEMVRAYRSGTKLLTIQAEYGLSKTGVYDILRRHDVSTTLRKEGGTAPETNGPSADSTALPDTQESSTPKRRASDREELAS